MRARLPLVSQLEPGTPSSRRTPAEYGQACGGWISPTKKLAPSIGWVKPCTWRRPNTTSPGQPRQRPKTPSLTVIPAKAGTPAPIRERCICGQRVALRHSPPSPRVLNRSWVPAFAGMTLQYRCRLVARAETARARPDTAVNLNPLWRHPTSTSRHNAAQVVGSRHRGAMQCIDRQTRPHIPSAPTPRGGRPRPRAPAWRLPRTAPPATGRSRRTPA